MRELHTAAQAKLRDLIFTGKATMQQARSVTSAAGLVLLSSSNILLGGC